MFKREQLKEKIVDEELTPRAQYLNCPLTITYEEEHEWGWVFYAQTFGPTKEDNPETAKYLVVFLADRKFGRVRACNFNGLVFSIEDFKRYIDGLE